MVVASSKKLLVLRCKKAKECQCTWKLRAMVVKDKSFFAINKYKGPHTCVNPCLNRDHQQLDSNLVVDHIKVMIKGTVHFVSSCYLSNHYGEIWI